MAQQFLNGPEVAATGQQVGREAVPQRMRGRRFRQPQKAPDEPHLALDQARVQALAALAKKHHTTLVCLTQKEPAVPSLGPLVSLRAQGVIDKTGFNRFTWELEILRDKRRGLGWRHTEVCRGPDGLC